MKLNKIYAIALAALTLTACSDDDDTSYNTASDVTVSMEEATMSVPEDNSGIINVPVVVSGKANGIIKVTVEVQGVGSNPAKADEHYILTSDYIYIPDDQTDGNIEFHATGDDEINENREFSIKIVNVEGAKVGTQATTTVTLVDDDHLIPGALAKLEGQWIDPTNSVCTIEAYPESAPNHKKQVMLKGLGGDPDCAPLVCDFKVDGSTEIINLTITCPQVLDTNANFGSIGHMDILALPYAGGLYLSGSISGNSNAAGTFFGFDGGIFACLFTPGDHSANGFSGYTYFQIPQLTLQKVAQ